ncbi:hypothetical protein F3Y22_tig00117034pilonHSYRG01179 [Hibiscus syriacus]|uniref:Uncharacterized protein n=1 Tax=Hibiscus syriacus TaxID=106335 RepID=A0A6A2WAQ7_HIBSY|nr:uncharacterized protein LOC120196746 [Hibiscus syriacus]KAE8655193.1 hypothetical protein F3Y22_tig00117034pilonHSYRG01179 [Hibiscus syriacus]
MASSLSSIPFQAQAATGSSAPSTSGSIRPFFAVISVLTFLAVLSCIVGRIYSQRRAMAGAAVTPLDTIKHGGCLGLLKLKCRRCMTGEVVEMGAEVMSFGDDKSNDTHPPAPPV